MRLRTNLLLMIVLVLALLAALPASAQEDDGGDAERGAELYAENCVACHGERGEGRAAALNTRVFSSIAPGVLMEQVITNGIEGTFMIPWSQENGGPLTDQDIQDIIAYINTWDTASEPPLPAPRQPAQEIPPVPDVVGDPNIGYGIYQQNCAVCHGEFGEGRTGTSLQAAFASIQPGQFARTTISRGIDGSLMPAWSQENGGPLTEEEIDHVVAYVLSIQQPGSEPAPEVTRQVSALPFVALLGGLLVVMVLLGLAVRRREQGEKAS
ncbi:MAG: hypothetical protein Kow00124_14070 [Anaerolineae bacterium]